MLSKIKGYLKIKKDRLLMFREFYFDYIFYKKWNYNNPGTNTENASQARILRQTHILEKGLSLSNPRKGFGEEKIRILIEMLHKYIKDGFSTDKVPFQNALCVLEEYIVFQKALGYENESINKEMQTLRTYAHKSFDAGIKRITLHELEEKIHADFPEFFNSRHSVRQFAPRSVKQSDIEKAVQLAMKAPTACNRQACKVYFYSDEKTNRQLGKLIAGNTGFDEEVHNYLVITADSSAFYDTFERNQLYVEGGIFAMALMEALHYYGIGSCALQNGEFRDKNKKFKAICKNIPESEKIVIFVAVGYYKDEFTYD